MEFKNQILMLFCGRIRAALERAKPDYEYFSEIRIRVNQPITLLGQVGERFLTEQGNLTVDARGGIRPELREIKEILEAACGYSGYAFEEEIKRGYLTIPGGHRIGLVGRAVINGCDVQTLKYISALNIRIAHPVTGCAEQWKHYFYEGNRPCHVLIISPPGCGKTTLLRDAIRFYSQGSEKYPAVTVGVADERSEIAGTYRGIAAYDLGMRTDVLDGCPKALGMEMLLRSMTPNVLAADEIGITDVPSIENALRCGCKMLATLHGEGLKEFLEKPGFELLVKERVFERYIFLEAGRVPGKVGCIYGRNFEVLWEDRKCT